MNTNQSLSQAERDELNSFNQIQKHIGGKDLILGYLIAFIIFCLFAPKIYVSNQIYSLSRDIAKISYHLELLKEENKNLKQELEDFRFQQILRMEP